jgi:hypothetical protein
VIHAYGHPDPPVPRLIAALQARGHAVTPAPSGRPAADAGGPSTLVLSSGDTPDPLALGVLLGAWRSAPRARVLVLSRIGAHPDARAPGLRGLWDLEERARASGLPTLTLRLAPLLGPSTPLWRTLRSGPRLPRDGRALLQPVVEDDAVETLHRAVEGRVAWEGWFEVAGDEAWSLAELCGRATARGRVRRDRDARWEPPLEEMAEHRLAESGPWREAFGIAPAPLGEAMAGWVA